MTITMDEREKAQIILARIQRKHGSCKTEKSRRIRFFYALGMYDAIQREQRIAWLEEKEKCSQPQ